MSNPFAMPATTAAPATVVPTPPTPTPPAVAAAPVDPAYAAWLASQTATPVAPAQLAQPAATTAADPFSGPAPQRPRGPRMREMNGRLLLITPRKVETVPNRRSKEPGATQERMTADVVILDGGVIHYGGRPEALPPTQHTMQSNVPMRIEAMFISAVGVVSQCREALAKRQQGQPGMVLGRLGTGEARDTDSNPPYLLALPTEADMAAARAFLATVDPFA